MKVIIAGSRTITSAAVVAEAVSSSGFDIQEVVSGGARGVDALGEEWAFKNGRQVRIFPADWDKFGKSAGPRRNIEMANYVENNGGGGLIAIWDGKSKGTGHMIQAARDRGLKVYIHRVDND